MDNCVFGRKGLSNLMSSKYHSEIEIVEDIVECILSEIYTHTTHFIRNITEIIMLLLSREIQ